MNDDARQILALMAFTGLFAIIGEAAKGGDEAGTDVKIFIGVGAGTVLLTLVAQMGSGAATFAKGVAIVALLASILKNGESVFNGLANLTGNLKSSSSTTSTSTSSSTKG